MATKTGRQKKQMRSGKGLRISGTDLQIRWLRVRSLPPLPEKPRMTELCGSVICFI